MESQVFKCPYADKFECKRTFDSQAEASLHGIGDHYDVPCLHRTPFMYYYCPYMKEFDKTGCLMTFPTRGRVEEHMKSDHADPEEFVPCPINSNCTTRFKSYTSLKRHVNHVHRNINNVFRCTWEGCKKVLKTPTGIQQHIKAVHWEVKYKCPRCNEEFSQEIHVKEHVAFEHDSITYPCPDPACTSTFSRKGLATKHFKEKHQGAYLMCPYLDCGQVFKEKCEVEKHAKAVHPDQGFSCEITNCLETFPNPAALKEHVRLYHPARLLPCPRANELRCMEMFVDEAQAEEHVKRSHAYIGVECRTCRQTFSTSYGRERHEKKHTHPFNCPRVFCECRFQSEEEAIEHSGEGRCRSSRNLYICPVPQCRLAVVGIVVLKGVLERHWSKHLEHGHIAQGDKIKYERGDPPPLKRLDLADNIYRHNARCFPDDQKIDNSNDAEDDEESQSLSEATTEANLQPTKDGEPGPSEDMDESGFAELVELVGSQNLKSPEDFVNFISKVSKGKGKSQLGKGHWFGTALLPDDVEDLFSDVHCGCILAHNVALSGEHPNIKINLFARGRKCAGPGLGTKWFVTEPCPCDMVIDLDTACLLVTRSRSGITITLCLQCVACQETKKVRRVLHYLEAGSQIQKVDFSFLRNMFRNAAKQQWEVKGKARQHFERIQQRAKEIENGRPGASMIILDDEFTIVGNTLMEFAAVEYMSGNTIINTLIDHDKDIWEISESKKLTVLNYMHMKAVYSAGRGLPLLNVHDVAEMIKNSGITPDTIVLVWHNGPTDLDLLRDFLATGQRGYERLIPNNANCICLLQFFRENLPPIVWENKTRVFPVGLEILFPVIYPGSNLVGRNHQAEVDCCQTRLVMKAFEWLCQPISQRGPVWKPMNIEAPDTLRITEFFGINDNGPKGEAKSLPVTKGKTPPANNFFDSSRYGSKNDSGPNGEAKSLPITKGKIPPITNFFDSKSYDPKNGNETGRLSASGNETSRPSASGNKRRTGAKRRGKRVPAAQRKARLNNRLVTDNRLITDWLGVDGGGPTNAVAIGSKRRHSEDSEKNTKRTKVSGDK